MARRATKAMDFSTMSSSFKEAVTEKLMFRSGRKNKKLTGRSGQIMSHWRHGGEY